jgi:tetratricopeptide (TPR) repeat protein
MNETVCASIFLQRIDSEIAAITDPIRIDCLRAEQACYLVRQGYFEAARTIVDSIRLHHAARPTTETSIWLHMYEAHKCVNSADYTVAIDRFRRALALAASAGLPSLEAISAAWLAQMFWQRQELLQMKAYIDRALKTANPTDSAAYWRVCLVVAQALHHAARPELAAPWYTCARYHAGMKSDDSAFSAIMYNMSSIKVAHLRQLSIRGGGVAEDFGAMLHFVESVNNYDQLVGVLSFESYLPILRAQVLSFEGRPDAALVLFDENLSYAVEGQGQGRLECYLLAELAWCHCRLGDMVAAKSGAELAESRIRESTHIDDRAATFSRLANLYTRFGDADRAQEYFERAHDYWVRYESIQTNYVELLSNLDVPTLPVVQLGGV